MISAGRCKVSITLAMVNVLPEPVTPRSTWLTSPFSPMPSTSSRMAVGWSPEGSKSETTLNALPPSALSGRAGR